MRGATHIAGNRLDLVMTNAPDILVVSVGSPFGSSDHCYVICVLPDEQAVSEDNVRNSVLLKLHTNWDRVRNAIRSLTQSSVLISLDAFETFNDAVGNVICIHVLTTVFRLLIVG